MFCAFRFWVRNVAAGSVKNPYLTEMSAPGDENGKGIDQFAEVQPEVKSASWVLEPYLLHEDPCTRCGQLFLVEHNTSESCVFHEDNNGRPGKYKLQTIPGGKGKRARYVNKWTCCGQYDQYNKGCRKRPHICQERMLSIRAETCPAVDVEDVEIHVFQSLEINIFKDAKYELRVQITKNLYETLRDYFSIAKKSDQESKEEGGAHEDKKSKADKRQVVAVYFQDLQFGDICVDVSSSGFWPDFFNVKNKKGVVDLFEPTLVKGIHSDLLITWGELIFGIWGKHAVQSVVTNAVASKFTNIVGSIFPRVVANTVGVSVDHEENPHLELEQDSDDDEEKCSKKAAEILGIKRNLLFDK